MIGGNFPPLAPLFQLPPLHMKGCEMRQLTNREEALGERLAVIESKLETVISELSVIRAHVPARMVEHAERIAVVERSVRTVQWLAGIFATGIIGTFLAHVLGR